MATLEYILENELREAGYTAVCGVDEAGRGPLCGPVVAAAVILPDGLYIEGLNDSKKLTEKKRERLFDEICNNAIAYAIAESSVEEINEKNILEASLLAMRRAIDSLPVKADFALIDGNVSRDFQLPARAVVHGKYSHGSGANTIDAYENVCNLYPNPASDILFVELLNGDENASVQIMSIDGKLVLTEQIASDGANSVDIAHLANGIYTVIVNTESSRQAFRLIVKK